MCEGGLPLGLLRSFGYQSIQYSGAPPIDTCACNTTDSAYLLYPVFTNVVTMSFSNDLLLLSSFFTWLRSIIPSIDLSIAFCVIYNRFSCAAANALCHCFLDSTIEQHRFCFSLKFRFWDIRYVFEFIPNGFLHSRDFLLHIVAYPDYSYQINTAF